MVYRVPDKLTNDSVRRVLDEFANLRAEIENSRPAQVYFDFTKCEFIGPVGIVLLASLEDELSKAGITCIARVERGGKMSRLLREFGIIWQDDSTAAIARKYSIEVHRCRSSRDGLNLANTILPHILSKTECKKSTQAALNWVLWEIFDNAGCHGYGCYEEDEYPLPVYAAAFSFNDRVEVSVLDLGCGIHGSLRSRYPSASPKDALELSIQKGITGHPLGSAGFGLFATSQLALRGQGTFLIWSSGRGLKVSGNAQKAFACPHTKGTLVSFSLKRDIEALFQEIIGQPPDDFFDDFLIT